MDTVLVLLFLASSTICVIELLKPSWAGKATRGQVFKFYGNDFNETGDAVGTPMQCFEAAHISHAGKCFCFTGKFRSGTRANVEDKAKSLGAVEIKKYPTLTTHYVVVGSLSSRDWLYSSHGTKIQQAKSMQAKWHNIAVISEDQWLRAAK
ncbi:BRCT domain-containing protein [Shewanella glacialipiscicola]|uniref:BRCT domain-containing protein n=1 Tax=Shewanella glacialipiscicola TaxID=614069 RepID=UPI003D7B2BE9